MFIIVLGERLEDEMDINNRIRDLRIVHNMSQEQLAEKVGTTKQAISQYERGIRKPKYEIFVISSLHLFKCMLYYYQSKGVHKTPDRRK
jgi:DNA-binding XRE family transcriptional regulator